MSRFVSSAQARYYSKDDGRHAVGCHALGRPCNHWPICALAKDNHSQAWVQAGSVGETRPGLYTDYTRTHYDDEGRPYRAPPPPSEQTGPVSVPEWVSRTQDTSLGLGEHTLYSGEGDIEATMRALRSQMTAIEGELVHKPMGKRVVLNKPHVDYVPDDFLENMAPQTRWASAAPQTRRVGGGGVRVDVQTPATTIDVARRVGQTMEAIDNTVGMARYALAATEGSSRDKASRRPKSGRDAGKRWKERPLTEPEGFSFSGSEKKLSIAQRKAALDEAKRQEHMEDMIKNVVVARPVPKTNDPDHHKVKLAEEEQARKERIEKRKENLLREQQKLSFKFCKEDELRAIAKKAMLAEHDKKIAPPMIRAKDPPKSAAVPLYQMMQAEADARRREVSTKIVQQAEMKKVKESEEEQKKKEKEEKVKAQRIEREKKLWHENQAKAKLEEEEATLRRAREAEAATVKALRDEEKRKEKAAQIEAKRLKIVEDASSRVRKEKHELTRLLAEQKALQGSGS